MGYENDTVDYSIRLWPFREPKGFFASTLKVDSFDTDREKFLGLYRHEGNPVAVEQGRCSDSIAVGGTPCGALHSQITLEPGETRRFAYIVGIGDASQAGEQARAKYADPEIIEREVARLGEYWDSRLAAFKVNTPDAQINSMVNLWNQVQCHTTFNWSRSASFNEAGGRDGLGFRDTNQDTLGVVHALAKPVKSKLIDLLRAQFSSGAAMHSVQPIGFEQGPHNQSGEIFSDDHLWLLISVAAYLKETFDFDLLDTDVSYAEAGSASVYEHLKRALDFSWGKRGPHGLCLGLAADWNDCLNLKGSGETTFSTFLFLRALGEFLELAKRRGEHQDYERYQQLQGELRASIDQHVWDGRWFVRGFLDSGRTLGGQASDQSKIFLNSQTWAVIADAASREKLVQAMDSVHEYLATEHGAVLNYPAYTEHDAEVGAITCFPKGLKENAGIFCHANTWAVVAEAILGRGDEAYRLYRAFLPAAKNESAEHYSMEPYVYSQFIVGKEHPSEFGRARNSWLTGTATWSFVAVSQYILGVQADYDGLKIDPAIPSDWPAFEVTREFRGATYEIRVKNPDLVSSGVKQVSVNGVPVEGNVLPVAPAGSRVVVDVVLGR
jgi:N,N'-diacetylchitobiose phosphorylase